MLGSIKAAIAAAATSIKSALPTVVAATTATVVTSSFIYYYTIKDGIYEKESGNVRYVLEKYISQISLDSITKKSGNKGYTYTQDFEKLVDDIIKELDEANSNIEEYTGKTKKDDILKKLIKAEIITQYPDLRSEDEIRKDKEVSENELQGGIKIIRKDSSSDTSGSNLENIDYKISNNDQILTYIPYSDFNNKITNNEQDIKNHFSIKSSGSNTTSIDIVVAGWTQENTTVTTVEYIPKDDGTGDQTTSDVKEEEPKYTFHEVNINYQNSLSKYSMPAGFLWSLLVMGESTSFVEKLANLAIDNTEIIIEAQDNVTTTVNTNVQKYTYKKDIEKTVILEDGTEETETTSVSAKTESSITTTIVTKQSNTSLNLTYAETWVATYKKEYKNTVNKEQIDDESWKENAEWTDLEDINLGSNTQIQTNDEGEETGKTVVTTYKIANKSATNIQTINTNTYTSAGTNVQERIDIDKDNNFVAYFNKSGRAKEYILQSPDWLYEMLESHEKTADMVDLFRYLLSKSTGNDYGVTTFDFSLYDLSSMKQVSSGTRFWWPIGSMQTTTEDGKLFASGEPALGKNDISRMGITGEAYGIKKPSHIASKNIGIDISGRKTPNYYNVISIADGTVEIVKDGVPEGPSEANGGCGNYVQVNYGNGIVVRFLHLYAGSIKVSVGDTITYGQVIGKIGHNGNSTGEHLHMDIKLNGVFVDPTTYVDPDNPRPSSTGIQKFIAVFEGGTQYYNESTGEYTIFHNTLDDNLELTGGVAVGKKSSGVSSTFKNLIGRDDLAEGSKISEEEYNKIFTYTYNGKVDIVNEVVAKLGITLNQNQTDAVISFCYNAAGARANTEAALTRYKNEGEKGYWEYIHDFTHSNGKALPGLVRRRAEEFEMFTIGDYTASGYNEAVQKHRQYNLQYGLDQFSGET